MNVMAADRDIIHSPSNNINGSPCAPYNKGTGLETDVPDLEKKMQ